MSNEFMSKVNSVVVEVAALATVIVFVVIVTTVIATMEPPGVLGVM